VKASATSIFRERSRDLAWCTASAASAIGLFDVVGNGAGLTPLESLQSTLLWLVLSTCIWGPAAGLAYFGTARARSSKVAVVGSRVAAVGPAALGLALAFAVLTPGLRRLGVEGGVLLALVAVSFIASLFIAARFSRRHIDVRIGFLAAGSILISTAVLGFRIGLPDIEAARRGGDRLNVVLIVLDTLRADHIGAYGHAGALTPHLDTFAHSATLYENAFASASWTVPSHATLFTGLPPGRHRASFDHDRSLDDRFTTLAESLGSAGYRTAAFSANRWLEIGNLMQGFDRFQITGAPFVRSMLRPLLQLLGAPSKWMDHGARHTVERTSAFLTEEVEQTAPLFLFVNLIDPHWRYLPPLMDRLAFLPKEVGAMEATWISTQMYGPLMMAGKKIEGPVEEVVRAFYAAAVRYQDRQLGELLESIDTALGRENTLVIITADHGENLGEAGRWDHVFAVNDHLIRVPLLIRLSKRFPPGLRIAGATGLIDIPATVADLIPALWLPPGEGRTLVPQNLQAREWVFAEGDPFRLHLERMSAYADSAELDAFGASLVAVRSSRFKYQRSSVTGAALFDLAADPNESDNVVDSWPEEAAALSAELDRWLASEGHTSIAPSPVGAKERFSEDDLRALRALGYVGSP